MDRGIKKWAPFQALEEQSSYLNQVFSKRYHDKENDLMDDQIEKINDILVNHNHEKIEVTYFNKFSLTTLTGYITKIDSSNKTIIINNVIIPFTKIKNLITID